MIKRRILAFLATLSIVAAGLFAGAAPASATSQDGRHTSGLVYTLGGFRYETFKGSGGVLQSDGGHWDTWWSTRWPLGGGGRWVQVRHYGGQVSVAESHLHLDDGLVLAGGASGCCRGQH